MYIAETVFIIIIIITIIIVIIIILTFMIIIIIIIVFVVVVTMFQNGQVMVTSLGFCCYSRRDPQSWVSLLLEFLQRPREDDCREDGG